jgi:hypothetical protein
MNWLVEFGLIGASFMYLFGREVAAVILAIYVVYRLVFCVIAHFAAQRLAKAMKISFGGDVNGIKRKK